MRRLLLELVCAVSASMVFVGVGGQAQAAPNVQSLQIPKSPAFRLNVQYRDGEPRWSYIEPGRYVPYGYYNIERPTSCGRFRYWDGDRCVDARDNPPDVGPR